MPEQSVYEIEVKSLLTKEKHEELLKELPKKTKLVNEEIIHSTNFRNSDGTINIRLRNSDKSFELVCKKGSSTETSREEITIALKSKEEIEKFLNIFTILNLKRDPSWKTQKSDFELNYQGYMYKVSLQNIENFAHVLEVEFLSPKQASEIHEQNIKSIIKELGCEPINKKDFSRLIEDYIRKFK